MTSQVEIYNMALSSVGTKQLVSLPEEASREAELCNLWYDRIVQQILRAAFWPCGRAVARLALQKERDLSTIWQPGDPEPGWQYTYSTPSDMIAPRYLTTFQRFALANATDNSKVIYTNVEQALLIYTKDQPQINSWDPDFLMAVVHGLAAVIALPLHGKPDRAKLAQDKANQLVVQARVDAANSDMESFQTVPDWISARGYAGAAPNTRFIYEYGPLISVTDGVGVH